MSDRKFIPGDQAKRVWLTKDYPLLTNHLLDSGQGVTLCGKNVGPYDTVRWCGNGERADVCGPCQDERSLRKQINKELDESARRAFESRF